jgi:hypothetical protein
MGMIGIALLDLLIDIAFANCRRMSAARAISLTLCPTRF